MANGVGWFEIGGGDFAALTSFYSDLFGWKLNDVSNGDDKYAMFQGEGDAIGGGLYQGEAKGPMIYIAVDDDPDRAWRQVAAGLDRISGYFGLKGMERVAVAGRPEDCVRGLREVAAAGAELILLNPVEQEAEQLERLMAEVAPHVAVD